jgi:hypothetical protein
MGFIAGAEINVSLQRSSLSPFHDGSIIAGLILSILIAVLLPLSALDKSTTVGDVAKSSAQLAVWMLTVLSLIWAGKIAMELLVQAHGGKTA